METIEEKLIKLGSLAKKEFYQAEKLCQGIAGETATQFFEKGTREYVRKWIDVYSESLTTQAEIYNQDEYKSTLPE